MAARNLRASPYAGKQTRWGDKRLWWFIVVARGKVHFEFMPDGWEQTGAGIAAFIARLPAILQRMLGPHARLPRVVFSDRGPGFYNSGTGHITSSYAEALANGGFRAFAGSDASSQPPDIADVLLHETVVGWARKWFKKHPVRRTAQVEHNLSRVVAAMEDCKRYIRNDCEIEALCHDFPKRLNELIATKGGRLKH